MVSSGKGRRRPDARVALQQISRNCVHCSTSSTCLCTSPATFVRRSSDYQTNCLSPLLFQRVLQLEISYSTSGVCINAEVSWTCLRLLVAFRTSCCFFVAFVSNRHSGALDVMVVHHEDGVMSCTPFHVRFSKVTFLYLHNLGVSAYHTARAEEAKDLISSAMFRPNMPQFRSVERVRTRCAVTSSHAPEGYAFVAKLLLMGS